MTRGGGGDPKKVMSLHNYVIFKEISKKYQMPNVHTPT